MNYIGSLAIEKKTFDYKSNERLHRALELKLFKDQKHNIKLSGAVSTVKDDDTLEKLNALKKRLKEVYGYCDECAENVLAYVASIISREEK
jgi:serine protein kinase